MLSDEDFAEPSAFREKLELVLLFEDDLVFII